MIRNPNDRGVILLSVLWIVLILSVASLSLATATRTQVMATGNSFDSERAYFMARGAAEVMFYEMNQDLDLFDGSPVFVDEGEFVFPLESGEVRVSLQSGRNRIDINRASDELLASMFDSLDVEPDTRSRLVDSILDWRDGDDVPNVYGAEIFDYDQIDGRRLPANGPFGSVDELIFVNGMTEELLYGRLVEDLEGGYRRIPGIRDLVTVRSDTGAVNPNEASVDVLAALPGMDRALAQFVDTVRTEEPFADSQDLVERVLALNNSDALGFLVFDGGAATAIVARARIEPSGVSRAVRMVLRREERLRFLSVTPLFFRRIQDIELDHWEYE
jgi:type II secretory pathway component PulK